MLGRKIVALKYGESVYNENYILHGGNTGKMLPISFVIYLIQDGKRNILVDAGCNDKAGFDMSIYCEPKEVLKQYGITPEEIGDIVITHYHHDHIEAVKDYPNAVIHIQKAEYEKAKKYILDTQRVEVFEEEKTLASDLVIKRIGGHTKGSCIVLCKCKNQRYVFCGDECYIKECFEKQIPTGSSYNLEVSKRFIVDYGNGEYERLLFHDPGIMKGRLGYEYV
jgi:glyoxylase-like metal-dependent hydrolase (beta-lactamase superfamily II)